jgi:hypothetical protein
MHKFPSRINVEHIKIRKSSSGVVVANRNNGNHVTVCWNKRLRRFDFHAKNREGTKLESYLLRPNEMKSKLMEIESGIIQKLLTQLTVVPIWWLNKNKYALSRTGKIELNQTLLEKDTTKGEVDLTLNDIQRAIEKSEDILFHPNWLYDMNDVFFATSRKLRKPKLIVFSLRIGIETVVLGCSYERYIELLRSINQTIISILPVSLLNYLELEKLE